MKLATYDDGSRDGQLVVVSRDLAQAHYANGIATRLQQVLDDWNFLAPQLEDLFVQLNQGRARHAFAFDAARCRPPLPRAHHWRAVQAGEARTWRGDGSQSAGARVPVPAHVQGVEASLGVAALTGDVAAGVAGREAIEAVRLLMLTQYWSPMDPPLTGAAELPAEPLLLACAPVLATPDELGAAWRGGRLLVTAPGAADDPPRDEPGGDEEPTARLTVTLRVDGRRAPGREAGLPRQWPNHAHPHLGDLIAAAAQQHALGTGTVVMWLCARPAEPLPLVVGQRLRAEVSGAGGHSLFGMLDQVVGEAPPAVAEPTAAPLEPAPEPMPAPDA